MERLQRGEIVAMVDAVFEDIEVPEWDRIVRVKSLTATERDLFEASLVAGEGRNRSANLVNIRAKLVAMCMVDDTGARYYVDTKAGAAELGARNGAVLDHIFSVCQRLGGFSTKDMEEIEKNSVPGLSESSPSISA